MKVPYSARDMLYSQGDRPDTVVRVSVKPGVLAAPPRVVLDLILVRSLRQRENANSKYAYQDVQQALWRESQRGTRVHILYMYDIFNSLRARLNAIFDNSRCSLSIHTLCCFIALRLIYGFFHQSRVNFFVIHSRSHIRSTYGGERRNIPCSRDWKIFLKKTKTHPGFLQFRFHFLE